MFYCNRFLSSHRSKSFATAFFVPILMSLIIIVHTLSEDFSNFHAIFTILSLIVDVACGKKLLTTCRSAFHVRLPVKCIINHFSRPFAVRQQIGGLLCKDSRIGFADGYLFIKALWWNSFPSALWRIIVIFALLNVKAWKPSRSNYRCPRSTVAIMNIKRPTISRLSQ